MLLGQMPAVAAQMAATGMSDSMAIGATLNVFPYDVATQVRTTGAGPSKDKWVSIAEELLAGTVRFRGRTLREEVSVSVELTPNGRRKLEDAIAAVRPAAGDE